MSGTLTDAPLHSAIPSFASVEDRNPDWKYLGGLASASAVIHIFLAGAGFGLLRIAPETYRNVELRQESGRRVTPLIAPPSALTQRAPNRNDLSKEFNLASLPPRPSQPNQPASPGAAALPRQRFKLPPAPRTAVPSSAMSEAPALDLKASATPPPPLGMPIPAPPPQVEPQEKPKLAFERPGLTSGTTGPAGLGRSSVPKPAGTVDETVRSMARSSGRGLIVGDEDAGPSTGMNPAAPSSPIPGRLGSAVELLSDPQGVDFWPYLVKVLSTVRRNWFAVIPESARLGRQGRTVIQFAINRDGGVPKLVIAAPSGTEALDRAAVAGVSASNPFPPLPSEFRGSQVRLQFVFKYNVR